MIDGRARFVTQVMACFRSSTPSLMKDVEGLPVGQWGLCDVVCKTRATWIHGLRLFHAVAATGTFPGFPVILVAEQTV